MSQLANERQKRGYKQEDMALKLGIGVSTYCQYETGSRNVPLTIAENIASIFEMSVNELFLPQKFTVSKSSGQKDENVDKEVI